MALTPKIESICYTNSNTTIRVTDTTGIYHVTTNPGGYNTPNAPKIGDEILAVTLLITFPNGETQEIDLTDQVPDPITGNFTYTDITPDYAVDGVHSFYYTVSTEGGAFYYKIYKLFLGRVKCCIDKLWAQVPSKMCTECETEEFINRVLFAQGLYNSLLAMGGCGHTTTITKLLTQIQKLCNFENCNC